jgi:hypothetical protein
VSGCSVKAFPSDLRGVFISNNSWETLAQQLLTVQAEAIGVLKHRWDDGGGRSIVKSEIGCDCRQAKSISDGIDRSAWWCVHSE